MNYSNKQLAVVTASVGLLSAVLVVFKFLDRNDKTTDPDPSGFWIKFGIRRDG